MLILVNHIYLMYLMGNFYRVSYIYEIKFYVVYYRLILTLFRVVVSKRINPLFYHWNL
jgi:hypothetical protein